jgi:integrase
MARNLLGRILDRGVKNGWLAANPVRDVRRLREARSEVDPLSLDEVKTLLSKGFTDPAMCGFYVVAIWTGLRTSELIGLKWTDLDWTTTPPTALIKRSFTKLDGEHPTKTPGSARPVDLRSPAEKAIRAQQAATRLQGEWVFCNSDGGPLDRDNLNNRVWKPALLRAQLRERSPYQCRHTFATLALSAGEEIGWVARQMGHESTEMIIRHYYRWIRNNTRQDGAALDRLLRQHGLD